MTPINAGVGNVLAARSLDRAWRERVVSSGNDPALSFRGATWTYGQLEAESDRFRSALLSLSLPHGALVGVSLPRGPELVAAILGIVRAGHGFVPLDPSYPDERLRFIAQDARIAAVVDAPDGRSLWPAHVPVVSTQSPGGRDQAGRDVKPEQVAYVIYTSGSTGLPKGVEVTHDNVLELLRHALPLLNIHSSDVWTLFHSCSFDFSVWEMWGALLTGARLVIADASEAVDQSAFARLLATEKVTVLNAVPSVFRHFVAAYAKAPLPLSLRYVIFGGEALEPVSVRQFADIAQGCQPMFVNMYGITEATVHTTFHQIDTERLSDPETGHVIGRELGHLRVSLVTDGRISAVGEVGEMWISGTAVARGYLHRAELTAERFVVADLDGQVRRFFRTGDLATRRHDGTLAYSGRADSQIKIRGFRIEPGEVEAVLNDDPGILMAAVVAECGPTGDQLLVAYVVPAPGADSESFVKGLRRRIAWRLPRHLIPTVIRQLPELPLTPSGKLDRLRLAQEKAGTNAKKPREQQQRSLPV